MEIKEAVKIVENCKLTRRRDTQSAQELMCLILINKECSRRCGKRLFSFFEMVSILSTTDSALSYVVSNIEEFTKRMLEEKNK